MTVNGISGTNNVYATTLSSASASLSPGAILLMLQRRMSDMDGQVDHLMREIESNTARSEFFAKRAEAVSLIRAQVSNAEPGGTEGVALDEIFVTWEDEEMTAEELVELLDLNDLPVEADGYADLSLEKAERKRQKLQRRLDRVRSRPLTDSRARRIERLEGKIARLDRRISGDESALLGVDTVTGNALQEYLQTLQL
ncbi:MAG: hypothetical protein AAF938_08450 [Myxococcota bacterium]